MTLLFLILIGMLSLVLGVAIRRKNSALMVVGAMLGATLFMCMLGLALMTMLSNTFEPMFGAVEHEVPMPISTSLDRSDVNAEMRNYANIQGVHDGKIVEFSTMSSSYHVTVVGDLMDVQVEQEFFNPSGAPIDATYMFPLNADAAVYAMEYVVGDEVITAQIQEKKQAQKTFEVAKKEGRSAALLVQKRPNIFVQSLANIPSASSVKVRIRYVHHAERRAGEYVANVPTKIGPRYNPSDMSGNLLGGQVIEAFASPIPAGMLKFRGTVSTGLNVSMFSSPSHPITTRRLNSTGFAFESGQQLPNDDFELRWTLAGANPSAAISTTYDAATDTTYFSAMVEPPAKAIESDLRPREIVFLLDCSGSMHGPPLDASRAFMHEALDSLRENDTFRVIRFSDSVTEFSKDALQANATNIDNGHKYVEGLSSQGGTEMTSGIRQALAPPNDDGRLRIVVFLTDGYIGNDFEVIRLVNELRGKTRMYAIGVGTNVNRFLLDEVATLGRGHVEYLMPSPGMEGHARSLALRIAAPVLTDMTLELGGANVLDVYPTNLPDLFEGQAVRAIGRIQGKWSGQGTVRGMAVSGRVDVPVVVAASGDEAGLVGRTWARQRLKELTRQMLKSPDNEADFAAEAKEVALGWSLMSQWTSFVAVSNKAPEPSYVRRAFEPDVHGTPEPSILLTGLMAAGAAFAARRRRRKEASDIE